MAMDPLHQFQIAPLVPIDIAGTDLSFTNSSLWMGIAVGCGYLLVMAGTRFLVVTHHPLTMARMDRLYGVTMTERGVSRLVSVALEQALELRATA